MLPVKKKITKKEFPFSLKKQNLKQQFLFSLVPSQRDSLPSSEYPNAFLPKRPRLLEGNSKCQQRCCPSLSDIIIKNKLLSCLDTLVNIHHHLPK